MRLVSPERAHLKEMMTWFSNKDEVLRWAGPNFHYPLSIDSFTRDLNLDSLDSFALISNDQVFLGFGQCYERLGYCHLGRLAISPQQRGKRLIDILIHSLCKHGFEKHQTSVCSLFVLENNHAAINAYKRLGFKLSDYGEEIPMKQCLYMLKTSSD